VSGWTKVILATAIVFVAMVGFNIALWRRLREARRLAALEERES
jgi:anti-sigma-K factor RskA